MSKIKILIVEDSLDIANNIKDLLELSGYQTMYAQDGIEALSLLSENNFDLIVSDISMPNLDGYQLFQKIKNDSNYNTIPFVFLTSKTSREEFRYGMNLGADDYLNKPFVPEELLESIRARLEKQKRFNQHIAQWKEIQIDLEIATDIQKKIFPTKGNLFLGIDYSFEYIPLTNLCGDIFDICKLDNSKIRVFIADALGHGIHAAMITMIIKTEYEEIKYKLGSPSEVISKLNSVFCTKHKNLNTMFPACILDIDLKNSKVVYSSGGFQPFLHIDKDLLNWKYHTGIILGVFETIGFKDSSFDFLLGDRLFLYTDGVVECPNSKGEMFGHQRLEELIKQHINQSSDSELLQKVIAGLNSYKMSIPFADDVTLISITLRE